MRLAAERHLRDLKEGPDRGLRFDRRLAMRAIAFIGTLKHTKGARWAHKYFELTPSQAFCVGSTFGWVRESDGLRRFRTAFWFVGRKWGKSELAGAVSLLVTFFDEPHEYGAEGYTAATKRDQAGLVFKVAKKMLHRAPAHRERVRPLTYKCVNAHDGSTLEPLSADANTLDGLNPHFVCIDELHAHPSSAVVDVLESGQGARDQPLQVEISTAGSNTSSICYEHYQLSERILDPNSGFDDDSWFAFIAQADPDDALDDPVAWRKANPNIGIIVKEDWYETRARRAMVSPTARAEFVRKNLNRWVGDADRAIDLEQWDRGAEPFDLEDLRGRRCFAAFDLAKVRDLSALVLVFPPTADDDQWYVWGWYYVPEDNIEERSRTSLVPYDRWQREGLLIATPGSVVDYDFIEAHIEQVSEEFELEEIAYDRYLATQLVTHLMEKSLPLVQFGQGYVSMSQPTNDMLRLIAQGKLRHGGNPVLRWMASNLVLAADPAGNVKPNKARAKDKIDGIVALVMALGRGMLRPQAPEASVYEGRGMHVI